MRAASRACSRAGAGPSSGSRRSCSTACRGCGVGRQRQAVLFDLAARRFYLFGLVLYPQDFIYLTGLLVVSALSLFLFTAVAGRLWCGYRLPADGLHRDVPVDRAQGRRRPAARACKLDARAVHAGEAGQEVVQAPGVAGHRGCGPASPSSATSRRSANSGHGVPADAHGVVGGVLGVLLRLRHLRQRRLHARAGLQVHVPLRALPERDVRPRHADRELRRGARRAARHARPQGRFPATGLGSCIDCTLCVQVCPTGIDIREGLQYECIGCAACVDVCDT
jgi:NAD-dependent dihydropyrimidine dehydrogenase PreA subunit